MPEGKRIAQLYRNVYEGDDHGEAWHGPALKPLLKDVTPEQAGQMPKMGRHSILQLVLHIAYWDEIDVRRLQGEVVDAPLNTPEDWPPNRSVSAEEWRAALRRLESSHQTMRNAMATFPDEKLANTVPGKKYDYYLFLHGIIDHCVYHSGQIALIKKAL